MILDKDGCSAVDLFLVFLQISGETPATNGQLHLISGGRHTLDALTWQMTLSLSPIIYRGQGMGIAEKSPGAFQNMISRFPAHLNWRTIGILNSKQKIRSC